MAYDEALADRVRAAVGPRHDVSERKMFGGVAFLLDGKMFCGLVGTDLMVRVGPAAYERSLARSHARPMDFTGRPMNGYVFVGPGGTRTVASVSTWVATAIAFVATVEKKPTRSRPPRRAAPRRGR
jgi:TfoX/Sxy family transcriptional regulator of competence genes